MIYELRSYEAMPGKLPALNQRFADHVVGFFNKHGIVMHGFWTPEIGTSNQLIYMLSFDSMADRESKWGAFQADPDWNQLRTATDGGGPNVARIRNTFMSTTSYSPEPSFGSNVNELRIYDAVPGRLPALNDRFANHTTRLFKKHGMSVCGYWTDVVGISNRLIYMLGYPTLGDREKSFSAFGADPEWQKARVESEKDGALVERVNATILRPTAYSPKS